MSALFCRPNDHPTTSPGTLDSLVTMTSAQETP